MVDLRCIRRESVFVGHSVGIMSVRNHAAASKWSKHWINSRISTESEIAGVDNHMPGVLWTLWFLGVQGFEVNENIVYQDNQKAVLMKRRSHHIDMW